MSDTNSVWILRIVTAICAAALLWLTYVDSQLKPKYNGPLRIENKVRFVSTTLSFKDEAVDTINCVLAETNKNWFLDYEVMASINSTPNGLKAGMTVWRWDGREKCKEQK